MAGDNRTRTKRPNRLADEQIPYLLQHAENPVDWMPWSDEAFDTARGENKPVFLSIGYSTCHWCHVMERESFEDEEVAQALNRAFVCIKVDREERPDIDQVYMTVCQVLTGSGGWPLTIIMTPDKKPFFAGTYLPKHGRLGRPGIMQVIESVERAWKNDPSGLIASSEEITRAIGELTAAADQVRAITESTLETAYLQLARAFDPEHGGFSFRPKFPTPHTLMLLLRYARRYKSTHALEMVEKTIDAMRSGGVFDHIGFGFHRYSTDERWLVPHFEKMLYDQALMAIACTEAFQYTHKPRFRQVVSEVLDYVLRDMSSPEGGFYSAEDADSEGVEGKFYVWTADEIRSALGGNAEVFLRAYNIFDQGNFLEESSGEQLGVNIPHLTKSLPELASEFGVTEDDLRKRLEHGREVLFGLREKRIHPLKDDKILTDWNGLMIAALAKAAQALNNPSCGEAARDAVNFILSRLVDSRGRLMKRYRNGQAGLAALLDDYAFFVWGLIELYEWCFDPELLKEAVRLTDLMIDLFEDDENGGFFTSSADAEELPVRIKEGYDGAIPSGNSVAALNLLRLGRMTGRTDYEDKARRTFDAFAADAAPGPSNHSFLMLALDFATGRSSELVIAGDQNSPETRKMVRSIWSRFLPNTVLMLKDPTTAVRLASIAPFTEQMDMLQGQSTAYVCENYTCAAPITNATQFESVLDGM